MNSQQQRERSTNDLVQKMIKLIVGKVLCIPPNKNLTGGEDDPSWCIFNTLVGMYHTTQKTKPAYYPQGKLDKYET
jgi:hypothetical protein